MMWLAIAAGGALGAMARHATGVAVTRLVGSPVPYATFAVNVLGCLVVGLLAGAIAADRLQMSTVARTFVFVGVLGGFTTFSTFGLDTFTLFATGHTSAALWNVAGQVVVGLAALYAGYSLAS